MKLTIKSVLWAAALLSLSAGPARAAGRNGYLVDVKCYDALLRNVNPWDTNPYVDRDKDFDIRYCSPNAKTKAFAFIDSESGLEYALDAPGNAKAATLVPQAGKRTVLAVELTGQMAKGGVQVSAIAVAK